MKAPIQKRRRAIEHDITSHDNLCCDVNFPNLIKESVSTKGEVELEKRQDTSYELLYHELICVKA
jgi:hypothetical protein